MAYEECCVCGERTDKPGLGDGSLYAWNGGGPFCEACWDRLGLDDDGRPAALAAPPAEPAPLPPAVREAAQEARRARTVHSAALLALATAPSERDLRRDFRLDAIRAGDDRDRADLALLQAVARHPATAAPTPGREVDAGRVDGRADMTSNANTNSRPIASPGTGRLQADATPEEPTT